MSLCYVEENKTELEPDHGVSKRTLANRRNAQRSTGPRTAEGKAIARCNAVKNGLAGRGVVLPEEMKAEAEQRVKDWLGCYKTTNQVEVELVTFAANTFTQLKYCQREETLARSRWIDRAELSWDEDRQTEVEKIAQKLSVEPELTVAKLKCRAHGAHWILNRWLDLEALLETENGWNDDARTLALDLLGVPEMFRDDLSPVDLIDAHTYPEELKQKRLAVVRREIADLEELIDERLIPLDESDRILCLSNLAVTPDAPLALIQRYERRLGSRMMSLLGKLDRTLARADYPTPPRDQTKPTPPQPSPVTTVPPLPKVQAQVAEPKLISTKMAQAQQAEVDEFEGLATQFTSLEQAFAALPPKFRGMSLPDLADAAERRELKTCEEMEALIFVLETYLNERNGSAWTMRA